MFIAFNPFIDDALYHSKEKNRNTFVNHERTSTAENQTYRNCRFWITYNVIQTGFILCNISFTVIYTRWIPFNDWLFNWNSYARHCENAIEKLILVRFDRLASKKTHAPILSTIVFSAIGFRPAPALRLRVGCAVGAAWNSSSSSSSIIGGRSRIPPLALNRVMRPPLTGESFSPWSE